MPSQSSATRTDRSAGPQTILGVAYIPTPERWATRWRPGAARPPIAGRARHALAHAAILRCVAEAEQSTLVGVTQRRRDDGGEPDRDPPPAREQLAPGTKIARYLLLERVGAGAMGQVHAAYDGELDRKVAVKLLRDHHERGASRLLREAQALAKLVHPNVVAVHDVGTHGGRVFVAMEFVEGETLRAWMNRGPHRWREVLRRLLPAGQGLAAAHAAGLVHRDFKPANVLLGRDGRVRVADFGLAMQAGRSRAASADVKTRPPAPSESSSSHSSAAASRADTHRLTRTGAQVGTPAYMAPEQFIAAEVDARADQFAFCVTLYEALYGERPFVGDSRHALMLHVQGGEVREAPRGSGVPKRLRRILLRGLASDPAARWRDMPSLLRELGRDPGRQWRRRAGAAVLAAAASGLTWVAVAETRPQPAPALCTGDEAAIGDAWTDGDRRALLARGELLADRWTVDATARLADRLDRWASDWRDAWLEACRATRIRGEQSDELLARRSLCLERRRRRMASFVELLTTADRELLTRAPSLVVELAELESCSDPAALQPQLAPLDPAKRREVEALTVELDALTARVLVDDRSAGPAVAALADRIAALAWPPVSVEYAFLTARSQLLAGDHEAGEAALDAALVAALAAGDPRTASQVANTLAQEISSRDPESEQLRRLLDIAMALVESAGDDDRLAGNVLTTETNWLRYRGDYQGCAEAAQRAADRYRRAQQPDRPEIGIAGHNLAICLYHLGRFDESFRHAQRSWSLRRDDWGPHHPRLRASLSLLGGLAYARGDEAQATEFLRRSLELSIAVNGRDSLDTADARSNHAVALASQGHYDEAAAGLREALAVRERELGDESSTVARARLNLASVLLRGPDLDEAFALADRGRATLAAALGDEHRDIATAHNIIGQIHIARGDPQAARREQLRALELLRQTIGGEQPLLREVYIELARSELALGRPAAALAWLETADRELEASDEPHPRRLAEDEFLRAQLLIELGDDPLAARQLAERARARLTDESPLSASQRGEIDAWLASLAEAPS